MKKIFECLLIICFGVSFSSIDLEEKNNVIYIDPGHGGMDGGCESKSGEKEKDINLEIALKLRNELEMLGFIVQMTRSGDYDLASDPDNRKRSDILKRCELMDGSLLYMSIHVNEYSDKSVRGAQVFYGNDNKEFAEFIQKSLCEILNNTNRKALRAENKYLLGNIKSTGCLVEVGFISNDIELALLKTENYQEKICKAITYGILEYLSNKEK